MLDKQSKSLDTQERNLHDQNETLMKQGKTLETVDVDITNVQTILEENFRNMSKDIVDVESVLTEGKVDFVIKLKLSIHIC